MELSELSRYLYTHNYSIDKHGEFAISVCKDRKFIGNLVCCEPVGEPKVSHIDNGLSLEMPFEYLSALIEVYKQSGGNYENDVFKQLPSNNFPLKNYLLNTL